MPGTRCTVAVCNNSHAKTKGKGVKYYHFPKDPEVRSRWVHLCRREGKWNPDSCLVCSEHFLPEDYERDLKSELLNLPIKRRLKKTAIPSQKLTKPQIGTNVKSEKGLDRKSRYAKRNNKKLVNSLICPQNSENSELSTTSVLLPTLETDNIKEKYIALLEENKILKAKLSNKQYILKEKRLKS
uniref:THAP-type domain-containing protein n=1 Tax=Clastoptera arizonana TaxID=38151 RepID=A0A1B6C7I1_9HEMI